MPNEQWAVYSLFCSAHGGIDPKSSHPILSSCWKVFLCL